MNPQADNPYEAPRSIPDGKPATSDAKSKPPIPGWAWAFAVACGIMPVLSLGGAIPGALGLGSAAACIQIARKPTLSVGRRVLYCAGVTVLCWGLFVAFLIAVVLMNR